jgi:hypothetical protein
VKAIALFLIAISVLAQAQTPDPVTGAYSVRQFGATGIGQDDTAAFQQAVNFLCGMTNKHQVILVPPGIYGIQTVRQPCSGPEFKGSGLASTTILRSIAQKPVLIMGAPSSIPLTTSLTSRMGNAVTFTDNNKWFSLIDLGGVLRNSLWMNGLTQFTVQAFVNVSAFGGNNVITSTQTDVLPHEFPNHGTGATISYDPNGQIHCMLPISNVLKTVSSAVGALVVGATTYVGCEFDGANVNLYVNGSLAGQVAATGTITQTALQNITVGTPALFGDVGFNQNACKCTIDSLEYADVARHSGPYPMPTAKSVQDSHTLALMNFDDQTDCDICTVVRTKFGPTTIWMRDQSSRQIGGLYLSNMTIEGSVIGIGAVGSVIENVNFVPRSYGLDLWNNGYVSHMRNITVHTGGPGCAFALGFNFVSGINGYENLNTNTECAIEMEVSRGLSGTITNAFLSGFGHMQYGLVLHGDQSNDVMAINGLFTSSEAGAPGFITPLLLDGPVSVAINGGNLESFRSDGSGVPSIFLDGISSLTMTGLNFRTGSKPGPTSYLHFLSAPTRPVVAINTFDNIGTVAQYSDLAGAVVTPTMQVLP